MNSSAYTIRSSYIQFNNVIWDVTSVWYQNLRKSYSSTIQSYVYHVPSTAYVLQTTNINVQCTHNAIHHTHTFNFFFSYTLWRHSNFLVSLFHSFVSHLIMSYSNRSNQAFSNIWHWLPPVWHCRCCDACHDCVNIIFFCFSSLLALIQKMRSTHMHRQNDSCDVWFSLLSMFTLFHSYRLKIFNDEKIIRIKKVFEKKAFRWQRNVSLSRKLYIVI